MRSRLSQSPSLRGSGRFRPSHDPPAWAVRSQSPSLRGSGRFSPSSPSRRPWRISSQSPSLRGSGRFGNLARAARALDDVSIPFIAGQWSLPWRVRRGPARRFVSIPFIAGQWSLLLNESDPASARVAASQSPSLRGSGRFKTITQTRKENENGLNPLHCGAVVASGKRQTARGRRRRRVSIPFIAGQWSLPVSKSQRASQNAIVSIPFIAGQWSLRPACRRRAGFRRKSLNPLHCGAVVASGDAEIVRVAFRRSQSPSLRGSGRFLFDQPLAQALGVMSQSPSLRGSGRFTTGRSLTGSGRSWSQSPSLRGSGRF